MAKVYLLAYHVRFFYIEPTCPKTIKTFIVRKRKTLKNTNKKPPFKQDTENRASKIKSQRKSAPCPSVSIRHTLNFIRRLSRATAVV